MIGTCYMEAWNSSAFQNRSLVGETDSGWEIWIDTKGFMDGGLTKSAWMGQRFVGW